MLYKPTIADSEKYLMSTYARYPVLFRKGRGVHVWDSEGKEYLDFVGGIATNILGHCHPKVVMAVQKQAQRLIHVSNLYHSEPMIELASILVKHSFADKVFFCNSGAEANEAAIKLARRHSYDNHGPNRHEIITALGSFHGRTLATITATGQDKVKKGFEPLMPGFKHVPFNDIDALKSAIDGHTCAVMLEPIQGEGGVVIPSDDYLQKVRALCDEKGILLIFDEVQTGMGRTGKLFAYEHFGIEPDIMTLAKGLGGGVPIGAMLAKEEIAASFTPGTHASTFGGNPLAASAAVAALNTVIEDGILLDNCRRMGAYIVERLEDLKKSNPNLIAEVRGKGLLVGAELSIECAGIVKDCMAKGLLVNCTALKVLRLMPAITVERKEIDHAINVMADVFSSMRQA